MPGPVDIAQLASHRHRSHPFGESVGPIELRRDDESPRAVDVAPVVARLHRCKPLREIPGILELQFDDRGAGAVDVSGLAVLADGKQPHVLSRVLQRAVGAQRGSNDCR